MQDSLVLVAWIIGWYMGMGLHWVELPTAMRFGVIWFSDNRLAGLFYIKPLNHISTESHPPNISVTQIMERVSMTTLHIIDGACH